MQPANLVIDRINDRQFITPLPPLDRDPGDCRIHFTIEHLGCIRDRFITIRMLVRFVGDCRMRYDYREYGCRQVQNALSSCVNQTDT